MEQAARNIHSHASDGRPCQAPAEFGKFLADETDKWAGVVKFAGIKLS
jgi:hypothetical protein